MGRYNGGCNLSRLTCHTYAVRVIGARGREGRLKLHIVNTPLDKVLVRCRATPVMLHHPDMHGSV
eukprot:9036149-Pyramimonas_sp.AAC.1